MIYLFVALLIFSALGMALMVFHKIPVLVELNPQEARGSILGRLKQGVKKNGLVKTFSSSELLLQKALSKFRILTLKTETKTSAWLAELRQKSIEEKKKFKDDYWKKLRTKK